jgi:hypothetical protein
MRARADAMNSGPTARMKEAGKCMVTGQPSEGRVVFAKAY